MNSKLGRYKPAGRKPAGAIRVRRQRTPGAVVWIADTRHSRLKFYLPVELGGRRVIGRAAMCSSPGGAEQVPSMPLRSARAKEGVDITRSAPAPRTQPVVTGKPRSTPAPRRREHRQPDHRPTSFGVDPVRSTRTKKPKLVWEHRNRQRFGLPSPAIGGRVLYCGGQAAKLYGVGCQETAKIAVEIPYGTESSRRRAGRLDGKFKSSGLVNVRYHREVIFTGILRSCIEITRTVRRCHRHVQPAVRGLAGDEKPGTAEILVSRPGF